MQAPLDGLRVVDSCEEKGELCGRLLADLGADVIRVEPPGGSPSRTLPPLAPDGTSLWFAYRNANKRSVTLDTSQDAGAMRALLMEADVWIESSQPGVASAADPDALRAEFPSLVVTSITDFGRTGPYSTFVGTDACCNAMGGMLYSSGAADRPPLLPPGTLSYDVAGVVAAFATVLAYFKKLRTGRGSHVDLCVVQAVAQITDWSVPNGSRMGFQNYAMARGPSPVYPIYPCADGFVRMVILSKRQWRAMRAWLGEPEIVQDDHWDTILGRLSAPDVLDGMYIEHFKDKTKFELALEGQRRGIAITPVLDPQEVLGCEHFAARGTFTRTEVAPGVTATVPSGFFELDGERAGIRTRAPSTDEHDGAWMPRASGHAPPPSAADPQYPLAGLRVLDFGIGGVGVETGRLLAEYGADVIKIESRTYPDFIRTVGNTEMSPSFASSSRSKRSLGVNCKTPEGREVVHALVKQSDVIIENSQVGVMDNMGVGYQTIHELNPRVVMMSSQMMGSKGPWSAWLGYGPSTRPVGGMTYLWNYPEGGMPPGSRAIHPDHLCGRLGALVSVASLVGRERTGAGVHAEVAQVEGVVGMLGDLLAKESLTPGSVRPQGNETERGAPWGVYRCAGEERWCVICVRDDEDWRRLRKALGDPEWTRAPEHESARGRIAARASLDASLEEWTSQHDPMDVMHTLQAAGVPCAYMTYPTDHARDPHFVARGYPLPIEQPDLGPLVLEGPAFDVSEVPGPITKPAPKLGEHTIEICTDLLGKSTDEIDRLIEAGVLEVPPPSPE